jgi:hypothetical protein
MSTAGPETTASPRRFESRRLLKINPDVMMACAFAAVGMLLVVYAAIAFPAVE